MIFLVDLVMTLALANRRDAQPLLAMMRMWSSRPTGAFKEKDRKNQEKKKEEKDSKKNQRKKKENKKKNKKEKIKEKKERSLKGFFMNNRFTIALTRHSRSVCRHT